MGKLACLMLVLGVILAAFRPAAARNDKLLLPIAAALESAEAKQKLDGSVKFFFGNQPHPPALTTFRSDVSNLKTNAFNKSDAAACNHVFLSTVISLQKRANQLGANAVVNIVSYYQKAAMSSATEFECHAGGLMAGVALKGDFVKIADK